MSLTKLAVCAIMITLFISPVVLSSDEHKRHQYFEGAMSVYSKFKEPSKERSEQFYMFIKSKWVLAKCNSTCSNDGVEAAKEYAVQRQVQLDNENH